MSRKAVCRIALGLAVFGLLAVFPGAALAGPPLICHPFKIGDAKSLAWNDAKESPKPDYDTRRVVGDTLALLAPETPVIVRMETLRRAMTYASRDPQTAGELLAKIKARAEGAEAKGKLDALAVFDYGYLVETYKQARLVAEHKMSDASAESAGVLTKSVTDVDGYSLVTKASRLRGGDPEMEFAAALITIGSRQTYIKDRDYNEHLRKAVLGAREGSLLAANLPVHFGFRGKTFAELRSNIGSAKN